MVKMTVKTTVKAAVANTTTRRRLPLSLFPTALSSFSAPSPPPVLSSLILFSLLFGCLHPQYPVLSYDMNITIVADQTHAGLIVENDKIYFGTVPQGAAAVRQIKLTNHFLTPLRVIFTASGEMGQYVHVPDNGALLHPKEEHIFIIEASIPQNAPLGSYTGRLFISFEN